MGGIRSALMYFIQDYKFSNAPTIKLWSGFVLSIRRTLQPFQPHTSDTVSFLPNRMLTRWRNDGQNARIGCWVLCSQCKFISSIPTLNLSPYEITLSPTKWSFSINTSSANVIMKPFFFYPVAILWSGVLDMGRIVPCFSVKQGSGAGIHRAATVRNDRPPSLPIVQRQR